MADIPIDIQHGGLRIEGGGSFSVGYPNSSLTFDVKATWLVKGRARSVDISKSQSITENEMDCLIDALLLIRHGKPLAEIIVENSYHGEWDRRQHG